MLARPTSTVHHMSVRGEDSSSEKRTEGTTAQKAMQLASESSTIEPLPPSRHIRTCPHKKLLCHLWSCVFHDLLTKTQKSSNAEPKQPQRFLPNSEALAQPQTKNILFRKKTNRNTTARTFAANTKRYHFILWHDSYHVSARQVHVHRRLRSSVRQVSAHKKTAVSRFIISSTATQRIPLSKKRDFPEHDSCTTIAGVLKPGTIYFEV